MKQLSKYFRSFNLGLQNAMEYRVNFLLNIVSAVFPVSVQFFLWTAVFNSSQGRIVYSYTYAQMITYTILAAIVSKIISGGFEWEIADDIKNGGLNRFIIKPIGYFQYRICCFLGQKSLHLGIMSIVTVVTLLLLSRFSEFNIQEWRIIVFLVSILLAIFLNFMIVFCTSTVAFWLSEAWGVFVISGVVVNIMSGGVFPLDVFGITIQKIFDLLPFKYTIFYPVNILNGKLDVSGAATGLLAQIVWLAILVVMSKVLWKAGMKKYIAVGG